MIAEISGALNSKAAQRGPRDSPGQLCRVAWLHLHRGRIATLDEEGKGNTLEGLPVAT